jgi:DNA recombination protein RmuC
VIVLGLKGLQIEQHAHEVMAYCAQLQKDFGRFKEDFELVGKHLGNASDRFVDAEKRLGRFESKLEQAVDSQPELEPAEAHELPRAVDAA